MKARSFRSGGCSWLMRQQDTDDTCRAICKCLLGIAAMLRYKLMRCVICHASYDQLRSIMANHHVLVDQTLDSEPTKFSNPFFCT